MLIEILDDQHIQGSAQYFSSIRSRDNFIDSTKNNILKISIDELKKIQNYWKIKNEVIDYKMDPVKRTQEKKSTQVLGPVLQGFYFVYHDYQKNGGVIIYGS